ncbi:hypothetical protein [Thalassolituus marinus]|uniref:Uncharacterized protein n=1 Tax=Thalassolituus marinus TaxID=671053 RepID=A0ABS7ZQP0_9GAMM|nr:hypothetical protein [Thalassolituus marinus]MCA6063488.1 hypothetical protein [Thalassolituus marinus]
MLIAGSILLAALSGLLLWSSKPAANWSGIASARFAAGLILLIHALLSLTGNLIPAEGQLIAEQLSLYAALPLLVATLLVNALGYQWSRLIWGRILLALCVVFELTRRAGELPALLWASLAIAAISALLQIPANKKNASAALGCWILLGVWLQQTALHQGDINLWLSITLIPVIYLHRRH